MSYSASFYDPIPLSVSKKLANGIILLFSTYIINLLNNCRIQKFLKLSLVFPIIKRPCINYNDFRNVRPISMLPIMDKLFEKIYLSNS